MGYRLEDELVRDAVKEVPDVEIEHPVPSEAALPAHRPRIQHRAPRPIPIGVAVEVRLHQRLQGAGHDGLGDPVRDGGHTENSHARTPSLRYLNRAHRWREVASRGEPIPELVEVVLEVSLELLNRLLIHAGRALVGLDPQIGLPNGPLGDRKRLRLRLAHSAPPASGG